MMASRVTTEGMAVKMSTTATAEVETSGVTTLEMPTTEAAGAVAEEAIPVEAATIAVVTAEAMPAGVANSRGGNRI